MEIDEGLSKTTINYLYQYWLAHDVSDLMSFEDFATHLKTIGVEIVEDENVFE